jgi:hypothetical protein
VECRCLSASFRASKASPCFASCTKAREAGKPQISAVECQRDKLKVAADFKLKAEAVGTWGPRWPVCTKTPGLQGALASAPNTPEEQTTGHAPQMKRGRCFVCPSGALSIHTITVARAGPMHGGARL